MEFAEPRYSASDSPPGNDRTLIIRDQLRSAIVDRRLGPGTKLVETEVGALFDVSRTVARAALQMLSFEGLVRIERNKGAQVAHPSPDEARQVFAARRTIEPEIALGAARRASQMDIEALRSHMTREAVLMTSRGPDSRRAEIRASGDFHLMIGDLCGNIILRRFLGELIARSSLAIAVYGRTGASSCGHLDHGDIVEALAAGDGQAASLLMLHHIDHLEADLDLRETEALPLAEALGHDQTNGEAP